MAQVIYEYRFKTEATGDILTAFEVLPSGARVPLGFQFVTSPTITGKASEIDDLIDFDPSLFTVQGPPPP